MSFRSRLFVALGLAVLVPLGLLAFGLRRELSRRLAADYERSVGRAVGSIRQDLTRESESVAGRLAALAGDLAADNRFRLAVVQRDPRSRRYLLDYAEDAMRLSGLAFLQLQDSSGRILSSGHFRNEYDQLRPELPRFLGAAGDQVTLVRTRTPEGSLLALARVDSLAVGGRRFTLTGGAALEGRLLTRLSPDPDLSVALLAPGDSFPAHSAGEVVSTLGLPYLDLAAAASPDTARLVITQSAGTLLALRRSLDAWLLATLGTTLALAMVAAAWMSSRISRPLTELAEKTSAIDLDRLDQDFSSQRDDEIGSLSRLLGVMTERLRLGSSRLREAERRLALGDLARQVNHDVKNGLVPIRNVLRHFTLVAQERPETLAAVFEERRATLDSSVAYLETLARNYARLSPSISREQCDVNAVVQDVVRAVPGGSATLRTSLAPGLSPVSADRLVLRRILENLVVNAVESLGSTAGGSVTVSTEPVACDGRGPRIRITVADTGPGMTRAELDRAFDDFYTTKEGGSGLGLSIVRRLVLDLEGTLRVDTEPGAGTRVAVELPALAGGAAAP
ncbi:MAG: HAMP domain-containing protein [Gemmatimonadales bacterium]|nr:HAMP domain-containing protein [Gemmatimonadales bacterium]